MTLNQEDILRNQFVFISYSHKDGEAVKEDMYALLSRGVRVWFDENMRLGDNWSEIAAGIISHKNCIGVIFYNSPYAFISSAVQQEQEMAMSRCSKGNFHIWSVHLDSMTTQEIIGGAIATGQYTLDKVKFHADMFDDDVLRINRSDSATTVERIYTEIAEEYGLVDNESTFMSDASTSNSATSSSREISLGRYAAYEYFGPEQPSGPEDQRFGAVNELLQLNGKKYHTKELFWKLMYVKNDKAILLCTQILDQMPYKEGEAFLENTFTDIAFGDKIRKSDVLASRYATVEDIQQAAGIGNEDCLKLSSMGKFIQWWINEPGMTDYWKQCCSDDFRYEKGFPIFVKKGVRPVIEVSTRIFKNTK